MSKYTFKQGRYYLAGVDRPTIIPISTLKSGIEDMGFHVISYDEAEKAGCGRSAGFTPPGKCGDDWDWIGVAQRTGPTQTLDIPDRVWWIYEYPDMTPRPPLPPGQAPPPPPPQQPVWSNPAPVAAAAAVATTKSAVKLSPLLPAVAVGSLFGLLMTRWLMKR